MSKISDFKLAESAIKHFCKKQKLPFYDFDLDFESQEHGVKGQTLRVGQGKNLGSTLYNIVHRYIRFACDSNHRDPDHESIDDILLHFATMIRNVIYSKSFFSEAKSDEMVAGRLYQNPLVWLLMQDIIVPVFDILLKNILTITGPSPYMDVARAFKKEEVDTDKLPDEDFIYVNSDVENKSVIDAHVLYAAIVAHGHDPLHIIQDIFNSDIYDKMFGLVEMSYGDKLLAEEFFAVLFNILGLRYSDFPHVKIAQSTLQKQAQFGEHPQSGNSMMWWYLGLPEKMLEPVRGSDWSVRKSLEPWIEEFWDKVEDIKKEKSQGDGVPFSELLRLKTRQSIDDNIDTRTTLQGLLSSQRIF